MACPAVRLVFVAEQLHQGLPYPIHLLVVAFHRRLPFFRVARHIRLHQLKSQEMDVGMEIVGEFGQSLVADPATGTGNRANDLVPLVVMEEADEFVYPKRPMEEAVLLHLLGPYEPHVAKLQ